MAAAAKAAMEIRQTAAKNAVDEQKKILSDAKKAQIDSLTITVNGQTLTIKGLNDQITALTNQITTIKLNEVDPAAQNIAQTALDNAIVPGTEDQVIADNGGLQGLIEDKPVVAPVTPVVKPIVKPAVKPVVKPKVATPTKVVTPTKVTKPTTTTKPNPIMKGVTANNGASGFAVISNAIDMVTKPIGNAINGALSGIGNWFGGLFKSEGGLIPKYLATGGFAKGTDTIPAMLTPGEFVVRRSAVESFGAKNLKSINEGTYSGDSVYNYSISVNAGTNASTDDIARAVMAKIKQVDSQRIRGNTF
jgi:hypothetical protein